MLAKEHLPVHCSGCCSSPILHKAQLFKDADVAIILCVTELLANASSLTLTSILQKQVAVITSNPEQSKHLETARMKLLDFELDLVNLRSETYSDSRIPQIAIGTPTQDAERRDLTINSLFYNINTSQVAALIPACPILRVQ